MGDQFGHPYGVQVKALQSVAILAQAILAQVSLTLARTRPTPFFSLPHFSLFFSLFDRFLAFSRFRAHVEVGSSSKEPAFDLFARVGRRGASRSTVFGPGKGSPLYFAKKS